MTALLFAAAWSTEAAAQTSSAGERNLTIGLKARAEYDSNVARGNRTFSDLTGVRPDDIRYNLAASVDASMPVGRQSVFLRGDIGYDFYQYNKSLKRERIELLAGSALSFGPCRGSATAAYHRAIADDEDLTLADSRSTVQQRVTVGATESCGLIGNLGQSGSVQHSEVTNSGARTLIGSQSTSVSGGLNYGSRTLGSLGLIGSYTQTSYDQPPTIVVAPTPDVKIYSVGLQYERPIGQRLSGVASISRYQVHRDSGVAPTTALGTSNDNKGTSWSVGLNYNVSSRLSTQVSFSSSVGASTRIGAGFQKRQIEEISASYQISPRLHASMAATSSKRDFPGATTTVLGVASREKRDTIRGNLGFDLGRKTRLSLDGRYDQVHTDVSLLDYSSYRIGLTASVSF